MNKNLKKVISTVAALAMSASTLVAFAADYPDVDASANYKQAVDELSALNIINGYEDGTFQPDKLVTRAEFSKMLITMLGKAELAQAESAAGSNTAFTDVPGSHWASGFVTAAATNGYINGMGDGTFAPDSNVTYAQAMKMLVCAAGYEQWAIQKNGAENAWPNSYLYYANQVDIGKGVSGVSDTSELTRAQVAQMIDNTLTAPVCVDTGKISYDRFGNAVPELEQKNGKGEDYQNILSVRHNAYKVKGMVTDNNKSTSGSLKADEVRFQVKVAKNFDDEEVKSSETRNSEKMYIADASIADALNKYVEAIIQQDDNDDWVILSVAETGSGDQVETLADNFDYDNKVYTDNGHDYVGSGKLYFREGNKTSSYKVADDVVLFVNGVKYAETAAEVNTAIDAYVKGNTTSNVILIDTPASDSTTTDGYMDQIMVEYYGTAVVDSVEGEADDDITVNFDAAYGLDGAGSMDIDLTDEEVSYIFTKDGAAVNPKDLAEDDVLSIKYDVTASSFDESSFFEVLVSSKTDAGKCTTKTKDKTVDGEDIYKYAVNGTTYKVADSQVGDLKSGTEYTVYLDVFNRIASIEEGLDSKKFAIVDGAYQTAGGENKVKLILPDGTDSEFDVKDNFVLNTTGPDGKPVKLGFDDFMKLIYPDVTDKSKKFAPQERVFEYNMSAGKISSAEKQTGRVNDDSQEYKENSAKIGKYTISLDATAFIDASEADDIKTMSSSTLKNGNSYEAYFFNKANSDNYYRFVIVTSNAGQAIDTSVVAVYKSTSYVQNDEEEDTIALAVVEGNDENKELTVAVDNKDAVDGVLNEGDAFMYDTNAKGEVIAVHSLTAGLELAGERADYDKLWDTFTSGGVDAAMADAQKYASELMDTDGGAEVVFGPVIEHKSKNVEIGVYDDGKTNKADNIDITIQDNANIYLVNYKERDGERVSATTASALVKASITKAALSDEDNIITWDAVTSAPRFALIKTVDGNATDVVVYVSSESKLSK